VYTVDAQDSVQQALAVRGGVIVYVGNDAGAAALIGEHTRQIDLHGRMLMPGLVDGHMHPLEGGASLLKCNLQYLQLTVEQMQAGIQKCLDANALTRAGRLARSRQLVSGGHDPGRHPGHAR
jgi:predicted amidohydrolase YtcJ